MMKRHLGGLRSSWKCDICEENASVFVCRICRRKVCPEDFLFDRLICKVCEMSICEICGKNLSIGKCENCGKIICQDCTAHFDGARRYCIQCWEKISGRKGKYLTI